MTCSMLSASIAVAVPRKYIRKPGCRRAAKEAGATGRAPLESVAVANQTPGDEPARGQAAGVVARQAAPRMDTGSLPAPVESGTPYCQFPERAPVFFGSAG